MDFLRDRGRMLSEIHLVSLLMGELQGESLVFRASELRENVEFRCIFKMGFKKICWKPREGIQTKVTEIRKCAFLT